MKVAILTANTQVYKEQEEDKGGKVIRKIVEEAGQHVIFAKALPVDKKVLSTVMQRMADGNMADIILTTGGAGCEREMLHRKQQQRFLTDQTRDSGSNPYALDASDKTFYVKPWCCRIQR